MSATHGKWRARLPPKEFAASLRKSDPWWGIGNLRPPDRAEVVEVLGTYVWEQYLDEETAQEILKEWDLLEGADHEDS
jgi:hypothetical protein